MIVFVLLSPVLTQDVFAVSADEILKIGLFYGNNALPSANLQNYTGSGYALGYLNADRTFTEVYSIADIKITVMKDKTIYIAGDGTYTDTAPVTNKGVIYPYHLQPSITFSTMNEAKAYADQLTALGYSAFPAYINGTCTVRIGAYSSGDAASAAAPQISSATGLSLSVVGYSKTCYTVTITGTSTILFEYDRGGATFAISPMGQGQKAITWFKGYRYYGMFEYNRVNGNDITVINVVSMQDYLKGVVPYEMSGSWPIEALKAQALCARSYALTNIGKHKSYGFDLCNTTDCQVYYGTASATANSNAAVDQTRGQYVSYNGSIAQTFYHSCDGGSTEDAENVWSNPIPYLRAVADPYEKIDNISGLVWSYEITLPQVTRILKSKGYSVSNVTDIYIDKFTNAGNVYRLVVVDSSAGKLSFSKESARTILNNSSEGIRVKSMRFSINPRVSLYANGSPIGTGGAFAIGSGGVVKSVNEIIGKNFITKNGVSTLGNISNSGSYILSGRGSGHNVGMSQYGAKGMAELGFSYVDIIKFYYTNVSISSLP